MQPEAETGSPAEPILSEGQGISYQYGNKYIVTPLKSGLALIDQRRAHIRVLYDSYRASAEGKISSVSQRLLFPEEIIWTTEEATIVRSLEAELQAVGFGLREGEDGCWTIDGTPSGMAHLGATEVLREVMIKVMETDCEVHAEVHHAVALTLAKAGALRYGQSLSAEERDHLIAALFSSPEPNLTPEGKTILTILTDEELSRRFG
jgi:DNA mismatch repair protein MutL